MFVSFIVAMDEEGGIGKGGKLPWRLSSDWRLFKRITMGHALIMGRKTFESIGRPLPGRRMVVLTRNPDYLAPDCQVLHSLEDALEYATALGEDQAFIIGGGEIFAQALPLARRIYLTRVHTRAGCDVFFPPFDLADWVEVERQEFPADDRNQYAFSWTILDRRPV